jgi:cytochrome b561
MINNSTTTEKYTKTAIALHWLIAIAVILQLASGIWMSDAIEEKETRNLAYDVFQWHKALGLTVLILSLARLFWRLTHKAPALPENMNKFERFAAHSSHILFYILMISVPLLGWAMVSVSVYGLPTMYFGLFEWPHLSFLQGLGDSENMHDIFEESHEIAAFAMLFLILIHLSAALKHHFIDKDNVLIRMLPFTKIKN